MSDYYLAEQLADKLGLTLSELEEAQACGLIHPVRKGGRLFYSSQQVYKLKAAYALRRKRCLSWEEVTTELNTRPLYQVSGR